MQATQMETQTEPMEFHQVDNEQQESGEDSYEDCNDEVILLKEALADKKEGLSRSIKKWKMETRYRKKAMKRPRDRSAKLDVSKQRLAALKASQVKQLQQLQEEHDKKVFQLTEVSKKQQWEQKRRFKEELRVKDEQHKLQLALNAEMFQKKLSDELTMVHQKNIEIQEVMKLRFTDLENSVKTTMAGVTQQWEAKEQQ